MCDIVDLEVVAPIDASFLVLLIGWTPEDGPKEKLAQVPAGSCLAITVFQTLQVMHV